MRSGPTVEEVLGLVELESKRAAWVGKSLHYMLPSADEWHKAAYYKGGGTNAGYWNYPLSSNTPPISGPPHSCTAAMPWPAAASSAASWAARR